MTVSTNSIVYSSFALPRAWADKSGAGITLTQADAGKRPASGSRNLNGKNVLDFDGTKTIGVTGGLDLGTGGPAIQVVTVLISDAYNANGHAYGYSSGNPEAGQAFSMSMNESGNKFTGRHWDGYTRFEGASYTTGKGYVLSHAMDAGATYADTQIVQNGLAGDIVTNLPTNNLVFDVQTPKFSVGSNPIGTNLADVAIGEILVFSEVLTDSDRRLLEGYLAHKWGLAKDLAIGHEYRVTDGTLVGDAAWADAKFGKGIYFDGNDDGLSFADLDELDAPREFAISIWFKREASVPVSRPITGSTTFFFLSAAPDPMTILKSERRVPRSKSIWMPVAEAKTPVWKSKREFRTTNGTIWS